MHSLAMHPLLVTIILFAFAVLLIYKYLTWHYGVFKKLGVAGPQPKVWIGNFPGKQHFAYELDEIYNKYKHNHQVIGVFFSRLPHFLILDPKLAHEILVTNFRKFRDNWGKNWIYDINEDKMASFNPFFNVGEEWKNRRTDVMSGLTQNKLTSAYPIWKSCAQKLSNLLKAQTAEGNAVLETKNLITRFNSNVLGEFLWGIETHTLSNLYKPNTYLEIAHKVPQQVFQSVLSYFKFLAFPWFRRFDNHRVFSAEIESFFSQLTKDAYVMRERDASNKNRVDFLNYVRQLQEKKNLSHDEVVGYMGTVFADGFDTASTVTIHTLFYLTHHPDSQEKVREEVLGNLDTDGTINYQTLTSLPYLDRCVHETMRLISPLTFARRICTESTELELNNGRLVPIKEGDMVLIPTFSYVHDPDYFLQPWEFKPDRFQNVDLSDLAKRGVFTPFGDGPRMCLGRHMAMLEVKSALAEILRNYRLKVCSKTTPEKKPDSQTLILGVDGDLMIEYEKL
ncbi:probable cytochrome P450 309a2 isoform X1 [Anastrepha ludens]|uniref:probable cytochrome P450 309a2 isoform X1 n=1 Tax=Anastrepha ludens TaxID=28586 RepID=UPI0023B1BB52|nr:probable cytochrome P450 309a2 isoform X1 [Anastrepha ludens]